MALQVEWVARLKHGRLRCIDSVYHPRIQTVANRPYRHVQKIIEVLWTMGSLPMPDLQFEIV